LPIQLVGMQMSMDTLENSFAVSKKAENMPPHDLVISLQSISPRGKKGRKHGGGCLVAKSCPTLATPWTVARQAPLSMGFSRQECWSGLPFPSPGDLPNPGIEPRSPALQGDSLPTELQGKPRRKHSSVQMFGHKSS